jgi:hypothetical protein
LSTTLNFVVHFIAVTRARGSSTARRFYITWVVADAIILIKNGSFATVESEHIKASILVCHATVELAAVVFFSKESFFFAIVRLVASSFNHILRRRCRLGIASLLIVLVIFLVRRSRLGIASLLVILVALFIRGGRFRVSFGFRLRRGFVVGWWRTSLGGASRLGLRLGPRDLCGMTGSLDGPWVIAGGDFGIIDSAIATTELKGSVAL